jgi:hypothetical protein
MVDKMWGSSFVGMLRYMLQMSNETSFRSGVMVMVFRSWMRWVEFFSLPSYERVPKSVVTTQGGKVTILWNQQVQTDRTIRSSKPDIIIGDNEKGTCMLIDIAIQRDRNVIKKEAGKILKYKDLTIKIKHMWNVKAKVIRIISRATGTFSKSFRKYVSDIPGNNDLWKLQKTAILGTAHILWKVLM